MEWGHKGSQCETGLRGTANYSTQLLLCTKVALMLSLIMLQHGICRRCLWMVIRFEDMLSEATGRADNGGLDTRLDFTLHNPVKELQERDESECAPQTCSARP